MDDPRLRDLLHEWRVEDAPRSLDDRVLSPRQPWWKRSLRVPAPLAIAFAAAFLVMAAALVRPRQAAPPPPPRAIDLADFHPAPVVQVRIMRGSDANR